MLTRITSICRPNQDHTLATGAPALCRNKPMGLTGSQAMALEHVRVRMPSEVVDQFVEPGGVIDVMQLQAIAGRRNGVCKFAATPQTHSHVTH